VMGMVDELNARGRTVVLITHEADVARHANRVGEMRDGQIISDTGAAQPAAVPA
jgi:ABC-type lipoprotein export system ATPase subunit